jgi:hypothetical protein
MEVDLASVRELLSELRAQVDREEHSWHDRWAPPPDTMRFASREDEDGWERSRRLSYEDLSRSLAPIRGHIEHLTKTIASYEAVHVLPQPIIVKAAP